MKDTDFLFLTAMLRAREVGMVDEEKIDRMLEASGFDETSRVLVDCGYPDVSGMSMGQIDEVLETRRSEVFHEIAAYGYAKDILDLFRLKYDYHNVKVLIKSAGVKTDAAHLLSASGRIGIKELSEAFVTGQRGDLPPSVANVMDSATGILSRTGNPQLADIEIDKAYFGELTSIAEKLNNTFISDYVRLLIDSANLRTAIRLIRTGGNRDFLESSLIPGGNVDTAQISAAFEDNVTAPFKSDALEQAVRLGNEALKGGAQTLFELACDNLVLQRVTDTMFISFGPAPVIAYLAKLEWEITVVRMILTGKYTGISKDVIRERLRDCHV